MRTETAGAGSPSSREGSRMGVSRSTRVRLRRVPFLRTRDHACPVCPRPSLRPPTDATNTTTPNVIVVRQLATVVASTVWLLAASTAAGQGSCSASLTYAAGLSRSCQDDWCWCPVDKPAGKWRNRNSQHCESKADLLARGAWTNDGLDGRSTGCSGVSTNSASPSPSSGASPDPCLQSEGPPPCVSQTTCVADGGGGYTCVCPEPGEYPAAADGRGCAPRNDCPDRNPCRNGGGCVDGVDAYSCACVAGYTGATCEIPPPAPAPATTFTPQDRDGDGDHATGVCVVAGEVQGGAYVDVSGLVCQCDDDWTGSPSVIVNPCEDPASGPLPGDVCGCLACTAGSASADGIECLDVDECAENTDDCVESARGGVCSNSPPGSFTCSCAPGFQGTGRGTCSDVRECDLTGADAVCVEHARCIEEIGGYGCLCESGWTGDGHAGRGGVCVDVDECAGGATNPCGANTTCTNTPGGFDCACAPGFTSVAAANGNNIGTGNGKGGSRVLQCVDVDECREGTDVCSSDQTCDNGSGNSPLARALAGTYQCVCPDGSAVIPGAPCGGAPAPEPVVNRVPSCAGNPCGRLPSGGLVECSLVDPLDTRGAFRCLCPSGYEATLDPVTGVPTGCVDVDECLPPPSSALPRACPGDRENCVNTPGSFVCNCGIGAARDGQGACTSAAALARSECLPGYAPLGSGVGEISPPAGSGLVEGDCVDVDECALGIDDCVVRTGAGRDIAAVCVNEAGGFRCECPLDPPPRTEGDGRKSGTGCLEIEGNTGLEPPPVEEAPADAACASPVLEPLTSTNFVCADGLLLSLSWGTGQSAEAVNARRTEILNNFVVTAIREDAPGVELFGDRAAFIDVVALDPGFAPSTKTIARIRVTPLGPSELTLRLGSFVDCEPGGGEVVCPYIQVQDLAGNSCVSSNVVLATCLPATVVEEVAPSVISAGMGATVASAAGAAVPAAAAGGAAAGGAAAGVVPSGALVGVSATFGRIAVSMQMQPKSLGSAVEESGSYITNLLLPKNWPVPQIDDAVYVASTGTGLASNFRFSDSNEYMPDAGAVSTLPPGLDIATTVIECEGDDVTDDGGCRKVERRRAIALLAWSPGEGWRPSRRGVPETTFREGAPTSAMVRFDRDESFVRANAAVAVRQALLRRTQEIASGDDSIGNTRIVVETEADALRFLIGTSSYVQATREAIWSTVILVFCSMLRKIAQTTYIMRLQRKIKRLNLNPIFVDQKPPEWLLFPKVEMLVLVLLLPIIADALGLLLAEVPGGRIIKYSMLGVAIGFLVLAALWVEGSQLLALPQERNVVYVVREEDYFAHYDPCTGVAAVPPKKSWIGRLGAQLWYWSRWATGVTRVAPPGEWVAQSERGVGLLRRYPAFFGAIVGPVCVKVGATYNLVGEVELPTDSTADPVLDSWHTDKGLLPVLLGVEPDKEEEGVEEEGEVEEKEEEGEEDRADTSGGVEKVAAATAAPKKKSSFRRGGATVAPLDGETVYSSFTAASNLTNPLSAPRKAVIRQGLPSSVATERLIDGWRMAALAVAPARPGESAAAALLSAENLSRIKAQAQADKDERAVARRASVLAEKAALTAAASGRKGTLSRASSRAASRTRSRAVSRKQSNAGDGLFWGAFDDFRDKVADFVLPPTDAELKARKEREARKAAAKRAAAAKPWMQTTGVVPIEARAGWGRGAEKKEAPRPLPPGMEVEYVKPPPKPRPPPAPRKTKSEIEAARAATALKETNDLAMSMSVSPRARRVARKRSVAGYLVSAAEGVCRDSEGHAVTRDGRILRGAAEVDARDEADDAAAVEAGHHRASLGGGASLVSPVLASSTSGAVPVDGKGPRLGPSGGLLVDVPRFDRGVLVPLGADDHTNEKPLKRYTSAVLEYLRIVAPFFRVVLMLCMLILMASIGGGPGGSTQGDAALVSGMVSFFQLITLAIVVVLAPMPTVFAQVTEVITTAVEFLAYFTMFLVHLQTYIADRSETFEALLKGRDAGLVVLGALAAVVLVNLIGQVTSFARAYFASRCRLREAEIATRLSEQVSRMAVRHAAIIGTDEANFRVKKYANRWLGAALRRRLKGWPGDFELSRREKRAQHFYLLAKSVVLTGMSSEGESLSKLRRLREQADAARAMRGAAARERAIARGIILDEDDAEDPKGVQTRSKGSERSLLPVAGGMFVTPSKGLRAADAGATAVALLPDERLAAFEMAHRSRFVSKVELDASEALKAEIPPSSTVAPTTQAAPSRDASALSASGGSTVPGAGVAAATQPPSRVASLRRAPSSSQRRSSVEGGVEMGGRGGGLGVGGRGAGRSNGGGGRGPAPGVTRRAVIVDEKNTVDDSAPVSRTRPPPAVARGGRGGQGPG